MIRRPDLHPDDLANRQVIGQRLRAARIAEGVSAYELSARLNRSRTTGQDLESTSQWAVRRVQAWARALNHRFTMTITGVQVPTTYDLHADILRVAARFGAADEDRMHLLEVVNDLIRVREHLNIPYQEMADRLGVTDRAVRGWELYPSGSQLISAQRYCRALGGALTLNVSPVPVVVPA